MSVSARCEMYIAILSYMKLYCIKSFFILCNASCISVYFGKVVYVIVCYVMKKVFCIANNCIKKKEKNINQEIKKNYLKTSIYKI